jgi:hypothetical protein
MKYQRYAKNQYKLLYPSSVPLSDTGTSHRRSDEIRPHQIPNEFGTMFFGIDTWLVAYGTFTHGPPFNKTLRINSYLSVPELTTYFGLRRTPKTSSILETLVVGVFCEFVGIAIALAIVLVQVNF